MISNLNDYARDQDELFDYRPEPFQIKAKPNDAGCLRDTLKGPVKEVSHLREALNL